MLRKNTPIKNKYKDLFPSGTTVPGDEGVVAEKEEGDGQYTDDCDDKWGEYGTRVVGTWGSNVERRRRREDEVAPLGAVHAAQPLRAIFGWLIRDPGRQ
jgi:hypothetical protein